jgi:hypothetical protein
VRGSFEFLEETHSFESCESVEHAAQLMQWARLSKKRVELRGGAPPSHGGDTGQSHRAARSAGGIRRPHADGTSGHPAGR